MPTLTTFQYLGDRQPLIPGQLTEGMPHRMTRSYTKQHTRVDEHIEM